MLKLPAGGADLNTVLPSAQRRNIRYYRAQAQESGLRIESATEETFPEFFAEFVQLHGARWAEHGQPGVLTEAKVQKFHFDAASAFLREKILRLYVLSLAKKIAAAIYLFVHRRRAYCYLAGFDPEFKAFSPGTLLIAHTIEQAFAEGCEAVDFLRGNERYKYRWGAADCPTYRRVFAKKEI